MSDTVNDRSTELLDGYIDRAALQRELRSCSARTIQRYEAKGLPVVVIGALRLYPVEEVRAWIRAHLRTRGVSRRRGRPSEKLSPPGAGTRTDLVRIR